jgi:hypothetical protein
MQQHAHVMLDLETMGRDPGSAIGALAAVEFYLTTGLTGREFYLPIDLRSCEEYGLTLEADTVTWWLSQETTAQQSLLGQPNHAPPADLLQALIMFAGWCKSIQDCEGIWGNGRWFDLGILGRAYQAVNCPKPWKFYQERDLRTLRQLGGDLDLPEFEGIKHHALYDARHQARCATACYQAIMSRSKSVPVCDCEVSS